MRKIFFGGCYEEKDFFGADGYFDYLFFCPGGWQQAVRFCIGPNH
jgi:hypothetical protein